MLSKTRIAPTPSGFLHRGNLFAFALNWLMARKKGLRILLRVDDLDRNRYRPEYLEDIFRSLECLGIDYDEGPQSIQDFEAHWSQNKRTELYREALSQLLEQEALFACNCSRKEVLARTTTGIYDGHCLRQNFKWEDSAKLALRWKENTGEASLKGWLQEDQRLELAPNMAYPIIYSKDKHVSYQLSSLVDDQHFGISHICRGDDLKDSTICQFKLAETLKYSTFLSVRFHHHSLLLTGKEKLSKSQAAPAAEIYKKKGAQEEVLRLVGNYLGLASGGSLREMLLEYREQA